MKVITLQHKNVLKELEQNHYYIADIERVPDRRVDPYISMSQYYNWTTCPIFGCEIGKRAGIFNGVCQNGIALEMNTPDSLVKQQYYYDWCDIIYFMEYPNEFADVFDLHKIPNMKTLCRLVYDFNNLGSYNLVQISIPYIKYEWITAISNKPLAVVQGTEHYGVLQSLIEYDSNATIIDSGGIKK